MQQILKLLFLTVSLLLAGGTWNDAYPQGHDVKPPRPTKPTTPVKPPRPNKPNRPTKPVKPNRPSKSRQQILDEIVENMVFVEGGTFTMGATSEQGSDADSDEKPAHSVTLSDYYIGKYEVTQAQWKAVMGKSFTQIASENNCCTYGVGDNYPMYEISYYDCQTFITELNQLTGKNFRLPTEAEWEYAARGGNKSRGYKYAGSNDIGRVAWYSDNYGSTTHPVGTKQANELGLYDMSGNVWEWCQDWYGSYSSSAQTNPTGPTSGSDRVSRGGGWYSGARGCRVSRRYDFSPSSGGGSMGFRLALSANTGPAALQSNQSSNVASSQMNNSTSMNPQSFTVNGVTFEMVKVEGGTFTMGATSEQGSEADDDEEPTHSVTLSDYYIGKYEVTQAQWKAVMGKSLTQIVSENGWSTYGVGDNYPMYDISYNDCQEFINKLNKLTGKKFRLPTEAEWEYAARGGKKSRGYKYAGSNKIDDVAWYWKNSGDNYLSGTDADWDSDKIHNNNCKTHPVGTKQPNELGLYDMSGNVWEWCQDRYGDYSSSSQTNPTGPYSNYTRVCRGSGYLNTARSCRVSKRDCTSPGVTNFCLGFRLSLSTNTNSDPTASQSNQSPNVTSPQADYSVSMNPEAFTVNGVTFEMVKVEGGTFTMGATSEQGREADGDEKPKHSVMLSDYYIGKYEVTQAQWKAVMGSNRGAFKGDNLPVECVSWYDCQTFINKLNKLTGKEFRLPTEAEWEYAARGGNKSKGYKYAGNNKIDDVAWYWKNSGDNYLSGKSADWDSDKIHNNNCKTHPVGTKQPNELGLYDMSGNVWEWCQDRYGEYPSSAQTNPTGPTSGSDLVIRGGSWYSDAWCCRVSFRDGMPPVYRDTILGFRLALTE